MNVVILRVLFVCLLVLLGTPRSKGQTCGPDGKSCMHHIDTSKVGKKPADSSSGNENRGGSGTRNSASANRSTGYHESSDGRNYSGGSSNSRRTESVSERPIQYPHTRRRGGQILADDGWFFANRIAGDFNVVPAPYGTASTEHPHWLWNGDGANLHPEPGWWPSKPGKWDVAQTHPGMPVPGYKHLVFADYENDVEPEVGYEFTTDLEDGVRTDWDVQPIVPQQFKNNREIRSLIKSEQKLRSERQALEKELSQTVLAETNHSRGADSSIALFNLQVSEAKERNAIETKESEIATIEIQIRDKVRDLIFKCKSAECISEVNDYTTRQLDTLRENLQGEADEYSRPPQDW